MAKAITFHSGSPLIGSPISYAVVPSAHQASYAFHRVTVVVFAALETDADYTTFKFSTPVDGNSPVIFDISSALRAVADRYEYKPFPPNHYPYIKFRMEAYDEWMADGHESGPHGHEYYPARVNLPDGEYDTLPDGSRTSYRLTYLYAFMGSFTDMERLEASSTAGRGLMRWTRKPATSPELVHLGRPYIRPANFAAGMGYVQSVDGGVPSAPVKGPRSVEMKDIKEGLNIIEAPVSTEGDSERETIRLYAVRPGADCYEIRFVNGLGCLESIHVMALANKSVQEEKESYVFSRQETFGSFGRREYVKAAAHEKWALTSGPVDEAWARWYVHELLQARTAWIGIPSSHTYIPCHILPDEEVKIINRVGPARLEVPFVVELDITGSPYAY